MKAVALALTLCVVTVSVSSQQEGRYFPAGSFYETATLDTAIVNWYSKHLRALKEPSLWAESKGTQLHRYRFLWLRTWDRPVSVRIDESTDGTAILTLKVATGAGGHDPGRLDTERTRKLTSKELEEIEQKFQKLSFWKLDTTERSGGRDGAQWIIEASENGHYHVVDRWSPKTGAVRDLGLIFLLLSDYAIDEGKLY